MDQVMEIIGRLLAAAFVGVVCWLAPKVKAWLEARTDEATTAKIMELVRSFARAAEQLYHDDDPTGAKRNQFVKLQLTELGVELTDAVVSMIEGAVFDINHTPKVGKGA